MSMYLRDKSISTIMWNIESEKFVDTIKPENIIDYVVKNTKSGSIIVIPLKG